jgi:hypothetical protein
MAPLVATGNWIMVWEKLNVLLSKIPYEDVPFRN